MHDPKRILLIKAHSLGVGDVLRASASWRVLKNRWPQAQLHLLFLSKHPGYVTEAFIKEHPLLDSATFLTIREGDPSQPSARRVSWRLLLQQVHTLCRQLQPDLIIDTESAGLRTSLLTWWGAHACGAQTVGVGQFPLRGLFYDRVSPSTRDYIQRLGLTEPMDYTHRDFVPLMALGLERHNTPIELAVTPAGRAYQRGLQERLNTWTQSNPRLKGLPVLGLNIGCGTSDAVPRRPDILALVESLGLLAQRWPHLLLLSGAPFEQDINQSFLQAYLARWGSTAHMLDLAGSVSLSELTGLIDTCDAFVSSDSGPYHMAVALKRPTLVWFNYEERAAVHAHDWCRGLIRPSPEDFVHTLLSLPGLSSQSMMMPGHPAH
jgi:ADP-heptose:LPS heptosyltransferase